MRSSYAKYNLIQCNVLEIMIDPGSYNEGIRNLLAEDQAGGSSLLFSDGPASPRLSTSPVLQITLLPLSKYSQRLRNYNPYFSKKTEQTSPQELKKCCCGSSAAFITCGVLTRSVREAQEQLSYLDEVLWHGLKTELDHQEYIQQSQPLCFSTSIFP